MIKANINNFTNLEIVTMFYKALVTIVRVLQPCFFVFLEVKLTFLDVDIL